MVYHFPNEFYSYKRSRAFIDWITEERFGQEDKGAWTTIEAETDAEAIAKFKWIVGYGKQIGAFV